MTCFYFIWLQHSAKKFLINFASKVCKKLMFKALKACWLFLRTSLSDLVNTQTHNASGLKTRQSMPELGQMDFFFFYSKAYFSYKSWSSVMLPTLLMAWSRLLSMASSKMWVLQVWVSVLLASLVVFSIMLLILRGDAAIKTTSKYVLHLSMSLEDFRLTHLRICFNNLDFEAAPAIFSAFH